MNQSVKMLNANVKRWKCENDMIPIGGNFPGLDVRWNTKLIESYIYMNIFPNIFIEFSLKNIFCVLADVRISIHNLKYWMYFTELIHNVILHHLFSESGCKSFWIIFKTRRFSLHSIYVQNNELNVWQRNNKSISLSYLFLFANILHF